MGKGSGGCRGEGARPNRLAKGDDYLNGVGRVNDAGWREDMWGDGEEFNRSRGGGGGGGGGDRRNGWRRCSSVGGRVGGWDDLDGAG